MSHTNEIPESNKSDNPFHALLVEIENVTKGLKGNIEEMDSFKKELVENRKEMRTLNENIKSLNLNIPPKSVPQASSQPITKEIITSIATEVAKQVLPTLQKGGQDYNPASIQQASRQAAQEIINASKEAFAGLWGFTNNKSGIIYSFIFLLFFGTATYMKREAEEHSRQLEIRLYQTEMDMKENKEFSDWVIKQNPKLHETWKRKK